MKVKLTKTIKPKKDLVTRFMGEKAIILDPKTTKVHELNEVASLIWKLVNKKNYTGTKIVNQICQQFEVDEKVAKKDVADFLQNYLEAGMISIK